MERLPRVFLDVDADQLEAALAPAAPHRERAALAQRPVVLGDLVVLGHVGIEVVLAREDALLAQPAAEREAELERSVDGGAVRARERPREPEANRADIGVGLVPERSWAVAEHLAPGVELDVALESDYRFVGHANSDSWRRSNRDVSPFISIARPAASSVGSPSSGPRSCTARGSPDAESPTGTLKPGMPARFAPIVKMSLRYIASGSSVFSPIRNGNVGEAGSSMKSQRANASWYSRRMRLRARCAVK